RVPAVRRVGHAVDLLAVDGVERAAHVVLSHAGDQAVAALALEELARAQVVIVGAVLHHHDHDVGDLPRFAAAARQLARDHRCARDRAHLLERVSPRNSLRHARSLHYWPMWVPVILVTVLLQACAGSVTEMAGDGGGSADAAPVVADAPAGTLGWIGS